MNKVPSSVQQLKLTKKYCYSPEGQLMHLSHNILQRCFVQLASCWRAIESTFDTQDHSAIHAQTIFVSSCSRKSTKLHLETVYHKWFRSVTSALTPMTLQLQEDNRYSLRKYMPNMKPNAASVREVSKQACTIFPSPISLKDVAWWNMFPENQKNRSQQLSKKVRYQLIQLHSVVDMRIQLCTFYVYNMQ